MTLIAARKPYYIEQNTDNLAIELRISYDGDPQPIDPQYTIVKTSYEDGVPEDLKINISPYLRDFFIMTPLTGTIDGTTQLPKTEYLRVEVNVNGTPQYHSALNGYEAPTTIYHYDTWQTVKSIEADTDSMMTVDKSCTSIDYILSDGSFLTLPMSVTDRNHVVPIRYADLSVSKTLEMKVNYPGGIVSYFFNVECPYYGPGTLGFVDQYGFWQYFDVLHKQDYVYTREASEYTSATDHNKKMYNANSSSEHVYRTGWVDDNWRRVLEAFMSSEHIVLHQGTIATNLVLKDKNKMRQYSRHDGLLAYEFSFDTAVNVIATI